MSLLVEHERQRVKLQSRLDAQKTLAERNRMGQFSTPSRLAADILYHTRDLMEPVAGIKFIDPAIGTGSFYSALLWAFPESYVDTAIGYEIDTHYGVPAARLWRDTSLDIRIADFTRECIPKEHKKFNMLVCNPPYVRHHYIPKDEKMRLRARTQKACDIEISGLAGLYCYFIGISHAWMADDAISCWLIPSEFMDVNYGSSIRQYLLDDVTLLRIHRFDPNNVQFKDALVSSAVIWFVKKQSPRNHDVRFTFGESLARPVLDRMISLDMLRMSSKWTRYPATNRCAPTGQPVLSDFFAIKRGLATGCNKYFILSDDEIKRRGLPRNAFKSILPGPKMLHSNEILTDRNGNPALDKKLFLLDCSLKADETDDMHPCLRKYLDEGERLGVDRRYICSHRKPWYSQDSRPPAMFMCTYIGRHSGNERNPFRFILNHSHATAANTYLMLYPLDPLAKTLKKNPFLDKKIHEILNNIKPQDLLDAGRVYGGGLYKLEPRELGNVPVPAMEKLLAKQLCP